MINSFIYFIIFLIFIFLMSLVVKSINRGIKAKNNIKSIQDNNKKNY